MDKSRILVIAPIGGFTNGADIAMNHQVLYLKSLGYHIFYAHPEFAGEGFDDYLRDHGIEPLLLEYNYWDDFVLNPAYTAHHDLEATMQLIRIIDENQIDLVITNTLNMPWGPLAAAFANKPHIWLAHEFPDHEFSYLLEKMPFIARASNAVLAASPLLEKELSERLSKFSDEVQVGHFLPFTDIPQISDKVGDFRLVNVNAINSRKNQLEILKAIEVLKQKQINVNVVFTGYIAEAAYFEEMRDFIQQHNLEEQVVFDSEGLNNWGEVRKTDIFVNPSKMETFSLTMVECLKLGIPMIVANNQATQSMRSLSYIEEDSVYEVADPNALANKIERFIDEIEMIRQDSQVLSLRVIKEQSISRVTSGLLEMVERLVGQSNPNYELSTLHRYFVDGISEYSTFVREDIPKLQRILEARDQENLEKTKHINDLKLQLNQLKDSLFRLQNSKSYKVGIILTSPFRKIKKLFKK